MQTKQSGDMKTNANTYGLRNWSYFFPKGRWSSLHNELPEATSELSQIKTLISKDLKKYL